MDGDRTGLVIMGTDYSYISAAQENGKLYVAQTICTGADQKGKEVNGEKSPLPSGSFYLRVSVKEGCICSFSYSTDGKMFIPSGENFIAKPGKWIGAKIGLFALSGGKTNDSGYADFDWFRIE